MDDLVGLFDPNDTDDEILPESLPPEVEEGNVEYKRKLVNPSASRLEHLTTQMKWRLQEGEGEAIYEIGVEDSGMLAGLTPEELSASLETLKIMAEKLGATVAVLREREVGTNPVKRAVEVLVRKVPENQQFIDLRLAVLGNVDAGKSTLIGVLTQGELDNGRGRARLNLFRHLHEIQSGRTSSISHEILGFDDSGSLVNYSESRTLEEICDRSTKLITLMDLCGHTKYQKTTVFGLTGYSPDFAMLVVSAITGMAGTTKEHLGLALALGVPVFIVVSKVDMCSEQQLERTLHQLERIVKEPGCNKVPFRVENDDDAMTAATNFHSERNELHSCLPNFSFCSIKNQFKSGTVCNENKTVFKASKLTKNQQSGITGKPKEENLWGLQPSVSQSLPLLYGHMMPKFRKSRSKSLDRVHCPSCRQEIVGDRSYGKMKARAGSSLSGFLALWSPSLDFKKWLQDKVLGQSQLYCASANIETKSSETQLFGRHLGSGSFKHRYSICPIFSMSSVTGKGLPTLVKFLNVLPPMRSSKEREEIVQMPPEHQIDEVYSISGVGTVVGGTVMTGSVQRGDWLMLGPTESGGFVDVVVGSLHRNRLPCRVAMAGQTACVAISPSPGSSGADFDLPAVRRGMVLVSPKVNPISCTRFQATVYLLFTSKQIGKGFQAVVHVGNVRQTAVIREMDEEVVTTNQQCIVTFEFISRPEYVRVGTRLIFREGCTKGMGEVTRVFPFQPQNCDR